MIVSILLKKAAQIFLLAINVCTAFAQPASPPQILDLTVPEFRPLTYSENGEIKGVGTRQVTQALDNMKWPYTISIVPNYGRAIAEVTVGRSDGFFLASESSERNAIASMSEPLLINHWSWFYRKDDLELDSEHFRKNGKIGTILNTNTHHWLIENGYHVEHATADSIHMVKLLEKDRLDAVFAAEPIVLNAMGRYNKTMSFNQRIEISQPMGIYISKRYLAKHPHFMEMLNRQITLLPK